ncbi:MAG: right-handed parallel beta-helix repeat-containing protein, partial [Proteobacteria bacterium]|nr:right-handed parallel beta-helix repeat-containing protein [Pseudomonadota bacterium]
MLVAFVVQNECSAREVYVSVDGHAKVDGSLAKPYGSLPDAVKAVRVLRRSGNAEPVKIVLREGRHQLDQTLVLGLEDGALASSDAIALPQYGAGETKQPAHLTIAAFPGEQPVVSGGVPVTGWKRLESPPSELPVRAAGKVWVADMPAGLGRFHCLFDVRGRLSRARDAGFAVTKPGDQRTLNFPEGALKPWGNIEDVEIQVRPFRPWVINMLPLASVDEASGVAKTGVSATYAMSALPGWVHNPSGSNVWVENVLEALDEPGEWVVNTTTRKVYLWPSHPAPDGSPQGILAPSTSELIRVEGTIDYDGPKDTPVRGIAFSGLTFTHADRLAWTSDETRLGWGMQHDWDMFDKPTATLRFRGAEECSVTACRFLDSGGGGLRMDLHAQRNRVENCEFARLGEAGILLAGYGPGTKDVNHHNDIVNNYIHHFSEITWHSPGFWAWQSGHNRISHNEMHHSGYAAVLITTRVNPYRNGGGLTGEGAKTIRSAEIAPEENEARTGYESCRNREKYIHSRRNLLEYNDISHAVQLLSDGNGIYVSGAGTGNIVRYNYLHDNQAHSLPAAIRCDDDQHDTLIYGNVLYKNHGFSAGIASKGVNDIINNFIVAPVAVPRWGYLSFEWVPVTGSKVHRNIIISHPEGGNAHAARPRGGTRAGGRGPKLEQTDMDSNLYFHPTDSQWMDEHLSQMRAIGKEKASLFGDPLFTDPAGGDFSFRPGSPALKLGIEPLDVSKMGRKEKDVGEGTSAAVRRPDFSWDHVPLYMHMRKATDFTPEELG